MTPVPEHLKPFVFKKGNKLGGRKKGKSIKEYSRDYLAKMSDEERFKFLNSLDPELVWKMAEGNPSNNLDLTTKGKALNEFNDEQAEKIADRIKGRD